MELLKIYIDWDNIQETLSFARAYVKMDDESAYTEAFTFQCIIDPKAEVANCYNVSLPEESPLRNIEFENIMIKDITRQLEEHYLKNINTENEDKFCLGLCQIWPDYSNNKNN